MKTINLEATQIIDGNANGQVGSTILVPNSCQILDSITKGDGVFVWVKIQTHKGPLSIGLVCTPNEKRERINLWKWLKNNLEVDSWILCGNKNMTDLYDDAKGPSAFIHDSKMRAWNPLVDHLDSVDNFLCVGIRIGPYYTR